MANKKKHHMDHNKLELAKHLANQSKRISSQYDRFVQKIIHFIHYASTGIDRVLFNAKYAKVVSLILAALLYVVVNYNDIKPGDVVEAYITKDKSYRSKRCGICAI